MSAEIIYPTVGMVLCNHADLDYKHAYMPPTTSGSPSTARRIPTGCSASARPRCARPRKASTTCDGSSALGLRGVMLPGVPGVERLPRPGLRRRSRRPRSSSGCRCRSTSSRAAVVRRRRGPKINALPVDHPRLTRTSWARCLRRRVRAPSATALVCVEADAGWVPHWMYRMDHAYKRHRNWLPAATLSRLPSEYFRENIYVTFQDDWVAFQMTDLMNLERLMWANDFPHSDSTWPWSQDMLRRARRPLSERDARRDPARQRGRALRPRGSLSDGLRSRHPRRHGRRRHRRARPCRPTSRIADGRIVAVGDGAGAAPRGRSTRPGASSRPASSTSTRTTTRRCCGTAMLTISPWHGVTTVVMGNCGFGVAPTRPEHRELIVRTLEKVEGMSARGARGGLGERLAVRDVPASTSTRSSARGTAHQRRRDGRPHAACASTSWARRRPSARRPPTRSRAMRAHRARGDRRRRDRVRDVEVADARRLRGPAGAEPRWPSSPRSQAHRRRARRRRAGRRCRRPSAAACSSPSSRARAGRPAGRSRGPRCWPA